MRTTFRCLLLCACVLAGSSCNKTSSMTSGGQGLTINFDLSGVGTGPWDLSGYDVAGDYNDQVSNLSVYSRSFNLRPMHRVLGGEAKYVVQVEGDGVIMSFLCTPSSIVPASYSISGATITICGGVSTVVVTTTVRQFTVNGNTASLANYRTYAFFTDGSYQLIR